jgi:hypothetical protein
MPLGIVLLLVWLVLLVRFPRVMLPVSGVLAGLGLLLALFVFGRQWLEDRHTGQLAVQLSYAPEACDFGRPLRVTIENQSNRSASDIRWQLHATQAGFNTNLLDLSSTDATFRIDQQLAPGETLERCYAVPRLRSGFREPDLTYRAEALRADFN